VATKSRNAKVGKGNVKGKKGKGVNKKANKNLITVPFKRGECATNGKK